MKDFGGSIVELVEKNDIEGLKKVYPKSNFDSIGFAEKAGEIKVENIEKSDNYKVDFGNEAWIEIVPDGETFRILKSRGIAAFPAEQYNLAKECGMFNEKTADIKLAERMADKDFFFWLKGKAAAQLSEMISMTPGNKNISFRHDAECNRGNWPVTVTNNTGHEVKAADYTVYYTAVYDNCSDGSVPQSYVKRKAKSKDIAPGSSVTINCHEECCFTLKAPELVINASTGDSMAEYKATGKEYQEYLSQKK